MHTKYVRFFHLASLLWVSAWVMEGCQPAGAGSTPTSTGTPAHVPQTGALATTRAEALATLLEGDIAPTLIPTNTPPPPTPEPTPTATPAPDLIPLFTSYLPSPFKGILPLGAVARSGQGSLYLAQVSPSGSAIAVGGSMGVTVYETSDYQQVWFGRTPAAVVDVKWSPDGRRIAAALRDGSIIVWDAQDGSRTFKLDGDYGKSSLAWSPDSTRLLSASDGDSAYLWDGATGFQLHRFSPSKIPAAAGPERCATATFATLSPNGRLIATTYQCRDFDAPQYEDKIDIWDAVTGEYLRTLDGSLALVTAWSPDSKFLAIAGEGGLVIWNTETAEIVRQLTVDDAHEYQWDVYSVGDIIWSPDGRRIAASNDHEISLVMDVETSEPVLPFGQDELFVGWSPDGTRYATLSGSRIIVRDTSSGAELGKIGGVGRAAGFSSDWATFYGWTGLEGRTLAAWDVPTGGLRDTVVTGTRWVQSITWSPDGTRLATGSVYFEGSTVVIWDARTGEALSIFTPEVTHNEIRTQVAWSPDGKTLAIGADGVTLLDVETGQVVGKLGTGQFASVAWSPNGSKIAVGQYNHPKIWDVYSGTLLYTLEGDYVTWSSDGEMIASAGSDGLIILWDASNGEQIRVLEADADEVQSVAFSTDGSLLAAVTIEEYGASPTVIIWDVKGGTPLLKLQGTVVSDWFWYGVTSIAWSPDGMSLAVAYGFPQEEMFGNGFRLGQSSAVIVWDVTTGQQLHTFYGHTSDVQDVKFSPDGSILASGSLDGTVILWNMREAGLAP